MQNSRAMVEDVLRTRDVDINYFCLILSHCPPSKLPFAKAIFYDAFICLTINKLLETNSQFFIGIIINIFLFKYKNNPIIQKYTY